MLCLQTNGASKSHFSRPHFLTGVDLRSDTRIGLATFPLKHVLKAAPERPLPVAPTPQEEYFLFSLGAQRAGVRSEFVREVARVPAVTPLPKAHAYLMGAMGHRGEVFPAVDLLRFLGRGTTSREGRVRVFVAEIDNVIVGFLVEQIVGLHRFAVSDRLSPTLAEATGEYISAVIRSESHGLVTVLHLPAVVKAIRERTDKR